MNGKRKMVLISISIIMVITLAAIVFYYWYENTYYVKTEDASVTGDMIKVYPQITGRLLEFNVKEGDKVFKNQILGHQEMINGTENNIEQSVIRAPLDGIIIKKNVMIGEIVSAGTVLAMIVDPKNLYLTANIEETKLGRIHADQPVDITIDQFEGNKYTGKVSYVGLAANSTFSLLPSSVGGTFTKVVQRIPIRIALDDYTNNILPGTNAIVKIHIK